MPRETSTDTGSGRDAMSRRAALVQRVVGGAVSAGMRAHSSPRVHRAVPAELVFRLAEPYAAWARRTRSPRWETFRAFHEELLQHTPLAGSEEDVAERACAEMLRCLELYWRPWLMRQGGIDGVEHLHAARATGRGVLAVFPHFGQPYAQYPIMSRFGIEASAISGINHFVDLGDGYIGRFSRQGRAYVDELGPGRAIVAGSAFEPALARLRDGAIVTIAFDLVGRTPTPFLGRTVGLASGSSRLACEADAMVVPFVIRRVGRKPVLRFAAPIDPRGFDDPVALQAAIATVMEGWALELPEAVWPLVHNGTPLLQRKLLDSTAQRA
jgi:lauroyl/myristoyl acyltransferase